MTRIFIFDFDRTVTTAHSSYAFEENDNGWTACHDLTRARNFMKPGLAKTFRMIHESGGHLLINTLARDPAIVRNFLYAGLTDGEGAMSHDEAIYYLDYVIDLKTRDDELLKRQAQGEYKAAVARYNGAPDPETGKPYGTQAVAKAIAVDEQLRRCYDGYSGLNVVFFDDGFGNTQIVSNDWANGGLHFPMLANCQSMLAFQVNGNDPHYVDHFAVAQQIVRDDLAAQHASQMTQQVQPQQPQAQDRQAIQYDRFMPSNNAEQQQQRAQTQRPQQPRPQQQRPQQRVKCLMWL